MSIFIRTTIYLLIIALCTGKAHASDGDTIRTERYLIVGYWGTLNHNPGLKTGLEKAYLFSSKYTVTSSLSLLVNRKPATYTSAGILFTSSLRRIWKSGLYFEHGLNLGYLGSYYDFDIYRTNAANEIVNVGNQWLSSIIVGYSLGLGYDFSKKTTSHTQLFIKPGIYYRFPNNDNIFYLNNFSIDLGIALHPKWLNKRN